MRGLLLHRKWLLLFSIILCTVLLTIGCPPGEEPPEEEPPFSLGDAKVAAYIRTWAIPAAAREPGSAHWKAGMIKGEYLSDLIIAFALIKKDDGYSLNIPDTAYTFSNMWDEIAALKKKYSHLKVNISVGGASEGGFSDMAADAGKRAGFIGEVCDWLEKYNLDGVDIDWEYPVRPLTGNGRPEDSGNYITLLRELRDALDELGGETGKRYNLSTAVPAQSWFTATINVKAVSEIIDGFKLMTYDYYGSWSNTTGHNANLYRWGSGWSTHDAVAGYLAAQVPPEKIIVGVGFYGQSWHGVPAGTNANFPGLGQSRTSSGGTLDWSDIKEYCLKTDSGYTRYWDNIARAPFLYNGSQWISYTDHEQIKEITKYVKDKGIGGVFVWEYAQDMDADLLKTLAEGSR
jgi:chitinase